MVLYPALLPRPPVEGKPPMLLSTFQTTSATTDAASYFVSSREPALKPLENVH